MRINLLIIGDIVGKPGRYIVSQALPVLVRDHDIHCVIANAENAAAGSGLTNPLYQKLKRYGVNLITMGDHVYRKQDVIAILETNNDIVRPANLSAAAPGKTLTTFQTQPGPEVAITSVLGRIFMRPPTDCPFNAVDRVLAQVPAHVRIRVVEIHAEATSEKVAMGWHLDGRASVVFGTHTHVATADARILPNGTAYITDLGMTGPYDSVLGRLKERVLKAMITHIPVPFDVATDDVRLCGVVVGIDANTGKAIDIERIEVRQSELPGGTPPLDD